MTVLLVDFTAGERHSRVGQYDGDFVAVALDVLFRELAEVDVCFEFGVHRYRYLPVADGYRHVEVFVEQCAFQSYHIVVGHYLPDVVLGRIQAGCLFHLHDERRYGVDTL